MSELAVKQEFDWYMSVKDMPHQAGFSYPVFEWSFGQKDGFRGGELQAWAPQGILVFQDRRDIALTVEERQSHPVDEDGHTMKFDPDQSEKLIHILTEGYGWGEPPHFREILQDVTEAKAKFPVDSKEKAEKIFAELKEKWGVLVS